MEVNGYTRTPKNHFECGLKASVTAMREMAEKSGPTYDKWRAAMARAAERHGWVTPPGG